MLPERPDIVLLDNMTPEQLAAVGPAAESHGAGRRTRSLRRRAPRATLAQIAATGVDRVSVGALTHSAKRLDVGLDYRFP